MSSNQSENVAPPSYKTINRGIQGFFVFTILGLIFIIWWKTPAGFTYLLEHLKSPVTLLIIPLIIGDYIIGGFRYSLFFDGDILPKISLWNCMRSNWANMFMGAITPFQTGGGPAQIYILWRQGAKISQSALVSLINFSSTLIFFQAASLFTIFILPPHLFGEKITNMIQTGFIIIFLATGFIGMILMFPNIGYKIIRFIFSFIPIRLKKLHSLKERLLETLGLEITLFRESFRLILKKKKKYLIIIVISTMILFINKYLLGYVVATVLSPGIDFKNFIGLQIIQYFLMYFAPTPGASGIAEISATWLMEKIMAAQVLVFYAVLYRFLTIILGALIGGVVLLFDLKEWSKTKKIESQLLNH